MLIESCAPVRIDFAGAWTDVKYFAHPFGGATVNAAIDSFVTGQTLLGSTLSRERKAIPEPEGISVTYETDIPSGSGLGTSSALNVVWLSLARGRPIEDDEQRAQIAEQAHQIETVLGILGGKQDHYAAALGGFNLFEFTEEKVQIFPIDILPEKISELEGLMTLCYTGQARLSSNLHKTVWEKFRKGEREVIDALFSLRESAYEAKEVLESGNFESLGPLLSAQHRYAKQLDTSLSNALVEEIFDLVSDNTIGGKCCGAGGGGCMIFLSDSPASRARVQEKLRAQQLRVIDFRFAPQGLTVSISE